MTRTLAAAAAAALLTACNSGAPTEQEQNLPERASGPEQLANTGVGNITPGTLPPSEQTRVTTREPETPAGPRGNRGSGTGGDSVPSQ
jgi:hypothetical protein